MASKVPKRIGKAQAREDFSSLIESVANGAGAVQITDYGKVAAVLLSEKEYEWLLACARNHSESRRSPRGLVVLTDANALDDASNQVKEDFESSILKTASEL
jgi:prevent-host-death family protein